MGARVLSAADELWLRLVWFTRLRWAIPLVLAAVARTMELAAGHPLFPRAPLAALLGGLFVANAIYAGLLCRFRDAAAHARALRALAHAQILVDLLVDAASIYFTGGSHSPFWPFLTLQVLVAALFFPRRAVAIGYAGAAIALAIGIGRAGGGDDYQIHLLALGTLLGLVLAVDWYFIRQVRRAQEAALELERLRAEKIAAEEIARHKDRVLSLVSHELGNPLAALRTFVELARGQKGEPAPAIEKVLGRMDAQVDRMARLVADLYDLRSAEHGQLRLEKQTCDFAAVVGEVSERFRALSPGVALVVEVPAALWGAWDPVRLDQLVSNLVGNAIKYAGEAGPIGITLRPASGSTAHLTVSDRGPGIPAEKLPLIFEPFQRADSGERRRGLGIGLALARQIALGHGGAIWAESRPGQGASFHVRLPTGGVASPS